MSRSGIVMVALMGLLLAYLYPGAATSGYAGPGLVEISPSNFESEVLQSKEPVVAYFWASW